MKIRFFSDLHNEFSRFEIPALSDDQDTLLILAGDIGIGKRKNTYLDFLADAVERFRKIIYIPGNHEYYGGSFEVTWQRMQEHVAERLNDEKFGSYLHMVNNATVIVDDVAFVCATLWTDFDQQNPLSMERARMSMSDYHVIRNGDTSDPYKYKLTPIDVLRAHNLSKVFIFEEIRTHGANGKKVVVVTHHGPSRQSIHKMYENDQLNGAYVSELGYDLLDFEDQEIAPVIWVHGHVHNSFDYIIGSTRIMTNPRGYVTYETPNGENRAFDPHLIIEV